jgi:hypothetical protein
MPQKTMQVEKRTYLVHHKEGYHWKILIRRDENSRIYEVVHRKGWQDGGEVEIFSLLPPATVGDEPLLHIRIYTNAIENDNVPPRPNPPISVQSHLPLFTFTEPEKKRMLVQLMCLLSLEDSRLKITPILELEG